MSSLTLSGILSTNHATRTAQGTGSLTAHYSGTVGFKVTHGGSIVSAIQFDGAGDMLAANTGKWKPLTTKEANYGDKAKFGPNGFVGEIYGLALTMSSSLIKASGGKFAMDVAALSGTSAFSTGNGVTLTPVNTSRSAANNSTASITLTVNPKTSHAVITIPIKISFDDDITLTGTIVATGKI